MTHSSSSLTESFQPGQRIFVAGLTGESALVRHELMRFPERAAGVEFSSIQLPGIDRTDYLAFHPEARLNAYFMSPGVRDGLARRRASLHAFDYGGIARHLLAAEPFDAAIGQFTPPDAEGWCSPGVTSDFLPLVWKRAKRRIGHLNPASPRLDSRFRVHISDFDTAVEADAPLLDVMTPAANDVNARIGRNAATLVHDGDTLQFGIGSTLDEVARSLQSRRKLRIYSGMVSKSLQSLWESGALDRDARIVSGVVFGDDAFYHYVGGLGRIYLDDVRNTHDVAKLATISRFVAINSAVEVDLFGQINSERSDGAIQAGAGGLPTFAVAASLGSGSRLLICMPATAKSGSWSRIVPAIGAGGLCTIPRYLADAVVTEFGVAELRNCSVDARAGALISVAHPEHRDALSSAWEAVRRRL